MKADDDARQEFVDILELMGPDDPPPPTTAAAASPPAVLSPGVAAVRHPGSSPACEGPPVGGTAASPVTSPDTDILGRSLAAEEDAVSFDHARGPARGPDPPAASR